MGYFLEFNAQGYHVPLIQDRRDQDAASGKPMSTTVRHQSNIHDTIEEPSG